ncbi:MAG: undecaprenyl-diphosphate phosphatase [Eubacteriales bacterium]|nr:undecaprenyl-diphosphate phosphatase [Eubacteriales bacterium]
MLNLIKAAFFGLVEGITEWLPVSSTGHMILLNDFITLDVSKEFWEMFLVVIQFGAIMAVIIMYWNTIWPIKKKVTSGGRTIHVLERKTLSLWGKTIVACIPAAVIGLALDDWLNEHFYNWVVVSIMLILVGIAFIIIEKRNDKVNGGPENDSAPMQTIDDIDYLTAFKIGIFQLIAAVFPGTSRSGATIIGGLLVGVSRKAAAEFTFILAIPVMAGASILKLAKYFASGLGFSGTEIMTLVVGMVVAFVVSIIVIRFLMNYIRKHDFKVFGWYRIILGVVVIFYFLFIN